MKKQIVLKIYGRVQGVFFRESSRERARELNISGWVRNEPDGTVALVAEGGEGNLQELIEWCKNGPYQDRVEKMDAKWAEPTDQFGDFVVK